MAVAQGYTTYMKQSILTSSPGELTLALFNGCVKSLNIAHMCLDEGNIARCHKELIRAQDIVQQLSNSLQGDADYAKKYRSLYDFLLGHLIEANVAKDPNKIDQALVLVSEMRNNWMQVLKLMQEGTGREMISQTTTA